MPIGRWMLLCATLAAPSSAASAATPPTTQPAAMQPAATQPAASSQVIEGDVLRDHDYTFELRRPSRDWDFCDEASIQRLNPDACAGLLSGGRGWLAITVERIDDRDLDEYVDLVIRRLAERHHSVQALERIMLSGEPAVELRVLGAHMSIQMAFLVRIVIHEGFGYQLFAWNLASEFENSEPDLRSALDSFQFMSDRRPRMRRSPIRRDAQGVDWRIRSDRYENASFGLRVTLPDGWRFGTRSELLEDGAPPALFLIRPDPFVYQGYTIEPIGQIDGAEFLRERRKSIEQGLRVEAPDERSELTIAGQPATHEVYRRLFEDGLQLDRALTTFLHGRLAFQIESHWLSPEADAAADLVTTPFQTIEFMEPEERLALIAELKSGDTDNAVGPSFSMRGGLYRDFLYGFTFRKPPGLWEAHTGTAAAVISPDSVLVLRHPARGLYVAVIPEFLDDFSPRQYHQVILDNIGAAEETPVRPLKHGDMIMRTSQFDLDLDGLPFSYLLVSAVHGDVAVQIMAWSLKPNLPPPDKLAATLAEAIEFPDPPPVASVLEGPTYRDYRLGYQVAAPGKGWNLKPQPASETDAVSSKITLARDGVTCVFMAMCLQDMTEELLLQVMAKAAGTTDFKERTRKESQDTLAGLPARRLAMTGRLAFSPAQVNLWTARRGNTVHGMIMLAPRTRLGDRREVTPESCKKCLSLIE